MGVDVSVRLPKYFNTTMLLEQCKEVPIDCSISNSWIHFHFGYWGPDHTTKCTNFIESFVEKHKVKIGKWRY